MKPLTPSKLNLTSAILDQKIKSLYIVSPHHGAGTTTCTYSLARTLSTSISEKVIIIDGNPGSNSLTKKMDLEGKVGVSDITIPGYRESLGKAINIIKDENFHIIPAGVTHLESSVWGGREELTSLLKALSENYNYILYDGPPIHKSDEPLVIAGVFDGVILVLKNNETRFEVANSAKDKILQAGGDVIGAIFNRRRYYVPQWVYDLL